MSVLTSMPPTSLTHTLQVCATEHMMIEEDISVARRDSDLTAWVNVSHATQHTSMARRACLGVPHVLHALPGFVLHTSCCIPCAPYLVLHTLCSIPCYMCCTPVPCVLCPRKA